MTTSKTNEPKKRILVADDNRVNLKLLERTLSEAGYVIISATNGQEALAKAKEQRPDLLILDIVMPGLDGIGVACSLKEDPKTEDIPIIFLSSLLGRAEETEKYPVEGTSVLSKPWKKAELLKEIAHFL